MLFRTVKLIINGNTYNLKRNSVQEIDLSEGPCNISIYLDWSSANYKIDVTRDEEIIISQNMPDWYFLVGICVLFTLFILTMLKIIPLLAFTTTVVLFFIPLIINLFINKNKYFKIKRNKVSC